MYRDPHDSRYTTEPIDPSWRSLGVSYALMVTTVLLLWSATNPLAGASLAAGGVGLFVVARRTAPLLRCLAECGGFVVDVTDDLQVCVVRPAADGPC